jgi:hypothetical protein
MKTLTAQAVVKRINKAMATKIIEGYHGSEAYCCMPNEYHFMKKYGSKFFEADRIRFATAIGIDVESVRVRNRSLYVKF